MKAAIWSPSLLWRRQGRGGKPQALAGDRRPAPHSPVFCPFREREWGMGQGRIFTCPDVRPRLSSPATCCCALTLEPLARQLGNDSPPRRPSAQGNSP